jgi:hypothetical protein
MMHACRKGFFDVATACSRDCPAGPVLLEHVYCAGCLALSSALHAGCCVWLTTRIQKYVSCPRLNQQHAAVKLLLCSSSSFLAVT